MQQFSAAIEKYLKTIYVANYRNIKVSGTYLAKELRISNAAVTDMANKLNELKLIKYQKHKEIKLTMLGKKVALKVLRRHRLWEAFLHRTLNLNLEELHREANLLEHSGSDKLFEKIAIHLGQPKYDPHGDPIPDENLMLPDEQGYPALNKCKPGMYEIFRLYYNNSDISNFFVQYDFKVGKQIELALKFKMDNAILLKVDKTSIVINNEIASMIFVKPLED